MEGNTTQTAQELIKQTVDTLFNQYEVGNIVEYNKDGLLQYGKIEEITGRFKFSQKERNIQISYRVGVDLLKPEHLIRRISLH